MQLALVDESRHVAFGEALGRVFEGAGRVYLEGDLGAGKTTLTRGILRAYGYQGAVKSPTYTLIEPYELGDQRIYHLDLYRLGDPEELEFIGGRDVLDDNALCLVEWPSRGEGWLPKADLHIHLTLADRGRLATLEGLTQRGQQWLKNLSVGEF
ncbi:tRNA (adenosine(37)-N6)-threonylcarbamoyltransferase complex ATPase subunit type 1 TsaE [Halomonas sp. TBZ9]|uniref:tRNA threonylcarbamoyladenosine biosynthesis protein TsaE n=1 Tax=Vreelandella azerica TaxID=2732867 RepID=A0A7Y3TW78_9GAMM|nr:tRNA (adenosine(37)-N6)-threonylcarbamoyltransferase complex ATPase subunit type 1 TsaE [Halomonas azerica]NOG30880.1 tRNA (adenosine(37)-N6)-threonylcarbamoyltransferase complex ATPase subunit type 1 TsaE [Halomonas azerica]